MKKILLLFYFLFYSLIGISQIWPKSYVGGTFDISGGAFESYDGGIIIGATKAYPTLSTSSIWVIKTDIDGDTVWTKTIPNSDIRRIIPTSDNGMLIIGNSNCDTMDWVPIAIKLNFCGDIEWCSFLTLPSPATYPIDVLECENNTYAVLCNYVANTGATIFKLDNFGNILWQYGNYSSYIGGNGTSFIRTKDNGFLISGYGYSSNTACGGLTLIKTDSLGQNFSAIPVDYLFGLTSIFPLNAIQTADSGYLVMGTNAANNRLFKFDNNFQPMWTKNYPMVDCSPFFLYEENDSTFLAPFTHLIDSCCFTYYSQYFKIFRFNNLGDTIQTATFNNNISGSPYWSYIFTSKTSDNKILLSGCRTLIAGGNYYHLSVLKLTDSFEIDTTFTSGLNYDTLCVQPISSGVLNLNCNCPTTSTGMVENNSSAQFIAFPNPSNNFINVQNTQVKILSIKLFTVFGQLVYERNKINSNAIQIDVSTFSTGVYFLQAETAKGSQMLRQIIER